MENFWNPDKERKPKNIFDKIFLILVASLKNFIDDNCFDKASTLTFYSLLSLIPLIAIGFGIAQELGFAERFTEQIEAQFQNQPEVAKKIIEFSHSTLKTTKGGLIAVFGLAILIWTVFRMIGNIATFFDEIWAVKTPRTIWQQIKSFIPMILYFPIFLVASNSVIIFMSTQAILASQSIDFLSFFGPVIAFLIQLSPYLINWALLSFLYIYLPNTKVSWKAGILAGFAAGMLYAVWQWIYVTFQANASSYGAIYGSFAAVPLFLIWLNYSWLIVLFGTELSHRIQDIDKK